MSDAPATNELRAECERLHKLAHDAPLNPYRLDADGHRWVEQYSSAWARHSRAWMDACEKRDRQKAAAIPSAQGAEVSVEELAREIEANITFDINGKQAWANGRQASRALLGKYRMEKR